MQPLVIGQVRMMTGFFGKALYLRQQGVGEVEKRLGYRAGRLRQGWWLLFLTTLPQPDGFEFAGYSHFSGGVPRGHLPRPPDPRTAEQRLGDEGYDLARIKQRLIRDEFKLSGPDRLAKVIPVADAHGEAGVTDYPPGSGVPQWKLTRPLPWKVTAFVAPGEMYRGMYV